MCLVHYEKCWSLSSWSSGEQNGSSGRQVGWTGGLVWLSWLENRQVVQVVQVGQVDKATVSTLVWHRHCVYLSTSSHGARSGHVAEAWFHEQWERRCSRICSFEYLYMAKEERQSKRMRSWRRGITVAMERHWQTGWNEGKSWKCWEFTPKCCCVFEHVHLNRG